MKNFLRIYFISSLLFLGILLLVFVLCNYCILVDIWYEHIESYYYTPLIFITSWPVFITCLCVGIARICTYKKPFIQWNKVSIFIDGGILAFTIGSASALLYIFGVYREVNVYNPKIPEEIHHVILTVIIATLTGLIIIFLKDGIVRNRQGEGDYFSTYYIISLLLAIIYGVITCVFNTIGYNYHNTDMLIICHTIFFIGGATGLSLGAFFSEKMEKVSRFVSQLIAMCAILIFVAVSGLLIYASIHIYRIDGYYNVRFEGFRPNIRTRENQQQAERIKQQAEQMEEEDEYDTWVEEDYNYPEEETEEIIIPYDGEIRKTNVSFLWDDESDDRENVEMALAFMEEKIDPRNIWTELIFLHESPGEIEDGWFVKRFESTGGLIYHQLANYIYNYRKEINLPGVLENYIRFLPRFITTNTYARKYRPVVNMLLVAYQDLLEEEENGEPDYYKFQAVYDAMAYYPGNLDYQEHEEYRFNQLAGMTNIEEYAPLYTLYSEPDKTFGNWSYSFWGRRYKEGIHKDVYYILQRIDSMYPQR